ncbi:MAG: S1 RNA-binding domain-containing protein [bacterium]|nr:S1 RNA-binding domain-containing protein [bacterium]
MQLSIGEILEGKVTGITNYGVFVDIGENKNGMVHISEVSQNFISSIQDYVKVNDVVKVKVINITEDGKVSLSMKRAAQPQAEEHRVREPKKPREQSGNFGFFEKKSRPETFEDMMAKFKQTSEEKFSELKRKNPEARRTKRGQ